MKSNFVLRKLIAVAATIALFSAVDAGIGYAADTNVAASDVGGTVVVPLTIHKDTDLQFGKFMAGTGGTIKVVPGATLGTLPTVTSGVTTNSTWAATATPAQFTVTGEPNSTYSIELPAVDVTMTHGSDTFAVNDFQSTPDATSGGSLPLGGTQVVSVGATATIASGQASGTYTGTFNVTVNYN